MTELIAQGVIYVAQAATSGGMDIVPTLLTGGGFSVIVAIVVGLFAWSNSKSSAAKSIAEGTKEFVDLARQEAKDAHQKAKDADAKADAAEARAESAESESRETRRSVRPLIDAIETLMARVTPVNGHDVQVTVTRAEITTIRDALGEARRHLR